MPTNFKNYDFTGMVDYHYGKFPPASLDLQRLLEPLTQAQDSISRYDQMLISLPNSELLLAPLRQNEAVISSRIEGTLSTVDEVMIYEADSEESRKTNHVRNDIIEVFLYVTVLEKLQSAVASGEPIHEGLIKNAHKILLSYGRGARQSPGEYKVEQNYIGDDRHKEIYFKPINPLQLQSGMDNLLKFLEDSKQPHPMFTVGIAHVEFESLHPFNDGNGRIGRLLITLLLWKYGLIHKPHFYISAFFEENKEQYIELMRKVSCDDDWTSWLGFFLEAIAKQAKRNLETTQKIMRLYEDMKDPFREISGSKWHLAAQDAIFENPIFKNSQLTKRKGIPKHVATRITGRLQQNGLLKEIRQGSGRRGALFMFEPLMEIVRA